MAVIINATCESSLTTLKPTCDYFADGIRHYIAPPDIITWSLVGIGLICVLSEIFDCRNALARGPHLYHQMVSTNDTELSVEVNPLPQPVSRVKKVADKVKMLWVELGLLFLLVKFGIAYELVRRYSTAESCELLVNFLIDNCENIAETGIDKFFHPGHLQIKA